MPITKHYAGQGCKCCAQSESECNCDVDWTDPEVYELRAKVVELEARLANTFYLTPDTVVTDNSAVIAALTKRIDELEAEVSAPKGWWVTSNDLHIWQLEQQAKGIEDYADKARGLPAIWMKSRINELRNQARALKEQS
jgi:hypothetical protein